jgi:hypothetical protein
MKNIFLFIGLITSHFLSAQKLYVPSIVVEYHKMEWYEEQLKSWSSKTNKNLKDEEAWLNKYAASLHLYCYITITKF